MDEKRNKRQKEFLRHSWIDPRLAVGASAIAGKGVMATEDIASGETLMIWGGRAVAKQDYRDTDFHPESVVPIDEHTYLGRPIHDPPGVLDDYLNHSCDPNAWLVDEVTVVARRDIKRGEEITVDCATWNADEQWEYLNELEGSCRCGSALCRKQLTPRDWTNPELQKRYAGHFSPYIEKRFKE